MKSVSEAQGVKLIPVDSEHSAISQVIRGEEWLPSLALHFKMYEAFGWEKPLFAHLPLILKPSGQGKLSKRDGKKFGIPGATPASTTAQTTNFRLVCLAKKRGPKMAISRPLHSCSLDCLLTPVCMAKALSMAVGRRNSQQACCAVVTIDSPLPFHVTVQGSWPSIPNLVGILPRRPSPSIPRPQGCIHCTSPS